jgi:hypothetical protein
LHHDCCLERRTLWPMNGGPMSYQVKIRGSMSMGGPLTTRETVANAAIFFPAKDVEASSPEEAARSVLSDVTNMSGTIVDEVWVSQSGMSWVFTSRGELLEEGPTEDLLSSRE